MTIELRRRNNGGQHVIVYSDGKWARTSNGARKALWATGSDQRIQAVKIKGISKRFLLDRPTWDAVTVGQRVVIHPFTGRSARLTAAWLRFKERVASWKK